MHLVEQYALSCGVKIDKPSIEESFYPIQFENYITIHASSGMNAKNYDHFSDVTKTIYPYLQSKGIEIIQIGGKDDPPIAYAHPFHGETTLKQTFYIIKNGLLHLGNDSFSTHVASGYNNPLVSLYSILYKECCGPYWGDKSKQILLEPDRKGERCSFSDKEDPKTVNLIKPEKVCRGVLDLLGITHDLQDIKTVHLGKFYHTSILEVIPNFVMDPSFMSGSVINLRMDLSFDERNLISWAQNKKLNIFTNKEIGLDYLFAIKDSVEVLTYELSMDTDPEYISQLKVLGIKPKLHTKDKENLQEIRLRFFDWTVLFKENKTKKDLDNSEELCDNSRYKSSKILLSNGQKYSSKAAWLQDKPGESSAKIIDCSEFWEEQDFIKIYNGEKNDKEE